MEMAAGSESPAADPSCPPFPLLEEEEGQHEQQEVDSPHGGELELPTVDLEAPGEALAAACRRLGVFRLANHGVPADLTARLFALARDLLCRAPFQDKQAQPGYFWGTPALSSLRVRDVNWVEGFHVALAAQQHRPSDDDDGLAALGDLAREYGAHMARVARRLFDALAADLGLGADQASSYLAERDGFLRAYRYPPCPEPGHLGMEAHTDSSVLSVINQHLVGGLQVLHDGAWRDVAPGGGVGNDDTLLVNLGDMARAISGDAYRSVRHRVAASRGADRLSLCYFAFPRDDAVITCAGSRYRPFTHGEFREQVQADIKATGSKVGLDRFLRH